MLNCYDSLLIINIIYNIYYITLLYYIISIGSYGVANSKFHKRKLPIPYRSIYLERIKIQFNLRAIV